MERVLISAALTPSPKRRVGTPRALVAWLLPIFVLVLQSGPTFADPIVYAQPAQSPVQSTRASQDQDTLGLVFQTFDSFTLAGDTAITAINWQGSYFNTLVADSSFAPPANSTGFTVAFYADNAGTPGGLLDSQTFSPFAANETFVGQQAFNATLGLSIYDYAASWVGLPFLANGGTTYWLSAYAHSPLASATEAQWGWNGGAAGDGVSVQSVFGVPAVVTTDRAFTLEGVAAPVPEPATLLLFGTGAAGVVARARRRRRETIPSALR
jgi:hypothetical protein